MCRTSSRMMMSLGRYMMPVNRLLIRVSSRGGPCSFRLMLRQRDRILPSKSAFESIKIRRSLSTSLNFRKTLTKSATKRAWACSSTISMALSRPCLTGASWVARRISQIAKWIRTGTPILIQIKSTSLSDSTKTTPIWLPLVWDMNTPLKTRLRRPNLATIPPSWTQKTTQRICSRQMIQRGIKRVLATENPANLWPFPKRSKLARGLLTVKKCCGESIRRSRRRKVFMKTIKVFSHHRLRGSFLRASEFQGLIISRRTWIIRRSIPAWSMPTHWSLPIRGPSNKTEMASRTCRSLLRNRPLSLISRAITVIVRQ